MIDYNREDANERFQSEVKDLLSGYLDSDARGYLALKIAKLHDLYLDEWEGTYRNEQ